MAFVGVEFTDEVDDSGSKPSEVVPASWVINDQFCLWPPPQLLRNINKLQRNPGPVQDYETWSKDSPIGVLFRCESYEQAEKLRDRCLDTSDVNSTDAEETTSKRKPKPNKRYEPLEDFESDFDSPSRKRLTTAPTTMHRPSPSSSFPAVSTPRSSAMSLTSPRSSPFIPRSSPFMPIVQPINNNESNIPAQKVFELFEEMKSEMRQQTRMLQLILTRLSVDDRDNALPSDFLIPATSKEELEMNNQLLEDRAKLKAVVAYLSTFGGHDIKSTTWRILKDVMTHEVSLMFSWIGRRQKAAFKANTKIVKAIKESVRKNPVCRNATDDEIENVIMVWLRNAGDRQGGRHNRLVAQQQQQPRNVNV